jgi:uncharacterized integral membrane protein
MRIARRILALVLLGLALVGGWRFASANADLIEIDLLLTQIPDAPLWLGLVVAFGVGAVLTGLLALYEILKLGLLARRYRKTVVRLEAEIHQLRNLPLSVEGAAETPIAAASSAAASAAGRDL